MDRLMKIAVLKEYFTRGTTEYLELSGINFKPRNEREFKDSLLNMVDLMKVLGGFIDPRRIGRFELAKVGDELGVRINHYIILERERLQYEDRFCYVMFDVINYVVENLMDLDEVFHTYVIMKGDKFIKPKLSGGDNSAFDNNTFCNKLDERQKH